MNKKDLTSRCTGIYFGEGPRWKENKLWFSDMQGDKVYTLDEDNNLHFSSDVYGLINKSDKSILSKITIFSFR